MRFSLITFVLALGSVASFAPNHQPRFAKPSSSFLEAVTEEATIEFSDILDNDMIPIDETIDAVRRLFSLSLSVKPSHFNDRSANNGLPFSLLTLKQARKCGFCMG